jgi:hypothetical protein
MDVDRQSRLNATQTPYLTELNKQTGPAQQREQACACGRCGACTTGVDLLQKQQRASRQTATNRTAARLEASLAELQLADEQNAQQSHQNPIQIPSALQAREEF